MEDINLENIWNKKPHIAISGIIGVGKTTLATSLSKVMNIPVYYEPVNDNGYLEDFYKNPRAYSFNLQIYLLQKRFAQQQQIIWSNEGGIQDRSIYEDIIFAKMLKDDDLMEKRDYETYIRLFDDISKFMQRPDIIIHLEATPEESLERIKKRSRDCETDITIDYLNKLKDGYSSFIKEISKKIPVFSVNWSKFKDPQILANMINSELEKISNIVKIDNF